MYPILSFFFLFRRIQKTKQSSTLWSRFFIIPLNTLRFILLAITSLLLFRYRLSLGHLISFLIGWTILVEFPKSASYLQPEPEFPLKKDAD